VKGLGPPPLPLFAAAAPAERPPPAALPAMSLGAHVAEDYAALGLSLKRHPLAFLRDDLDREGMICAAALVDLPPGRRVSLAGLVLIRQRPGTASGVIFMTIEDETGVANLIVWPGIFAAHRRIVLGATLVGCTGRVQREGLVIHVAAERLFDLSPRLRRLRGGDRAPRRLGEPAAIAIRSRDFR
jgi:error-prone DNA polymerase